MIVFDFHKTLTSQRLKGHINLAHPMPDIFRIFNERSIGRPVLDDPNKLLRRFFHTNDGELLIVGPLIDGQNLSLRQSDPYGRQNRHFV